MLIGRHNLKNKMILAPMAGVSDYPFRMICRDYGCDLAYSEMVSSEGLVRGSEKTSGYLYKGVEESLGNKLIGFQIFGSDPYIMGEAAKIVQEKGADIVDINMGCPVKKVVKTNAGSALLDNIPLIKNIVSSVRKKIDTSFTVKIRAGWGNTINAVEVSKALEDSGVDAIIIHPRTQKQGFSGKADWQLIRKVKSAVRIPVIGNGDVVSIKDYDKMLHETNCDAVMVGRGAMGNPWIFRLAGDRNYNPSIDEIKSVIIKHFDLSIRFYGDVKGIKEMRKHLSWYTKGFPMGNSFRAIINQLSSIDDIFNSIEDYFTIQKNNFSPHQLAS